MADPVHVKGLSQLTRFLQELPPKLQRNVIRGAARAGARLIQNRARANIHSISGQTAKSIKVGTRNEGSRVIAYVKAKSYKGIWLEYGTRPHVIKPKNRKALAIGGAVVEEVHHPGARARPFLRPALDTEAAVAVVAMATYMKQRLATKHGIDTSDVQIGEED